MLHFFPYPQHRYIVRNYFLKIFKKITRYYINILLFFNLLFNVNSSQELHTIIIQDRSHLEMSYSTQYSNKMLISFLKWLSLASFQFLKNRYGFQSILWLLVFFPDISQGSGSVHCFSNPSYHTLSCGVTSRFFTSNVDGNSSSKVDIIPSHCSNVLISSRK